MQTIVKSIQTHHTNALEHIIYIQSIQMGKHGNNSNFPKALLYLKCGIYLNALTFNAEFTLNGLLL